LDEESLRRESKASLSAGVSFLAPPGTHVVVTSLQAALSIGNESVPACLRACIPLILLCRRDNAGLEMVNRKSPRHRLHLVGVTADHPCTQKPPANFVLGDRRISQETGPIQPEGKEESECLK
jgi:hypothetical protein